ncbi:MAG: MFS transporter [Turicibacter sp.]|nr:MFS transporter [Turicibacter sp.]
MAEILNTPQKRRQFIFSYLIFTLNGILALSIGALLPYLRESRGLSYPIMGLLVSLHSVGNLFSSFTAGILPKYIGRKKSILLFNSCYALAFFLILTTRGEGLLLFSFLLTGIARGATSNFCNLVINALAPGKAWLLSGLHSMFAIGAFAMPLIVMGFAGRDWRHALYFLMAAGLLSWLLYLFIPLEVAPINRNKIAFSRSFLKNPTFWLVTLTLFFYLGAEQGVIGWLVTYFRGMGALSPELSQIMASALWVMILIGRLLTALLATKVSRDKLLLAMGAGLLIFFLILINATQTSFIVIGISGFGLSMAGVYPTVVSYAGALIKENPLSWSFILTGAALGAIIMPAIIGFIAERAGIFYGMASIGGALILSCLFFVFLIRQK